MKKKLPLLLGTLLCLFSTATVAHADEYDTLRLKWRDVLTGGPALPTSDVHISARIAEIDAEANRLLNGDPGATPPFVGMNTSPTRTYLWADIPTVFPPAGSSQAVKDIYSSQVNENYTRLRALAYAYATDGCALEGNASLLTKIIGGLDWVYANHYNTSVNKTSYPGNWFHFEIAAPIRLADTITLLWDQLTATQRTNWVAAMSYFTPGPKYTAANLVWTCRVTVMCGILGKNAAKMVAGRDGLTPALAYYASYSNNLPNDGFARDGSFVQHVFHAYTGGYGIGQVKDFFTVSSLLAGSTWQVTNPQLNNAFNWVYDSFEPVMFRGAMMNMVAGRTMTRDDSNDYDGGRQTIEALLFGLDTATGANATNFKSMIKAWVQATNAYQPFLDDEESIWAIRRAKQILADPAVTPRPIPFEFRMFAGMDRAVAHRPTWSLGIAMFSKRIANYESINLENLKGWHTGSGMTYLYTPEVGQFSDAYWPTIDARFMPGTTILNKSIPLGATEGDRSTRDWVGGAALDLFGAVGWDVAQPSTTLTGKRSWFVLDEEVVMMGAGIGCTDTSNSVQTVVENRQLNATGNNAFTVNGTPKSAALGWSETMTGVNWAHLAGATTAGSIGYYFPTATNVIGLREARTGNWKQINNRPESSADPITRNYLSLRINHGTNVSNQSFAYTLLPGKIASDVASYAAAPRATILENSTQAQGVVKPSLGLTAINFWQDVSKTLGGVTTADKSSFVMLENAGLIDIAVADPTWSKTTMNHTVNRTASSVNEELTGPGFTVTQLSPTIQFTSTVTSAHGVTRRLVLDVPIVVDNDNANNSGGSFSSFVGGTGGWASSTGAGFWGTNYMHDNNTGEGTKSFTFTPNLPVAGNYQVQIWYVAHAWRSTAVPVDIVGSNGTTTVSVNQQLNGSQWVSVGPPQAFAAGTGGRVTIRTTGTTGTNTFVVADAVRFVRVPPITVTVDNTGGPNGSTAVATGTWSTSTSAGFWGSNFVHDNKAKGAGKYFTFTPNLPSAGNYKVFLWHPAEASRAPSVPVKITSNNGTETFTVNQQVDRDQWVLVATRPFSAGMSGSVRIETAGTSPDHYVTADAVRFVKQ